MGELGMVNSKGSFSSEEGTLAFGSGLKCSSQPDPASISEECLCAAEEAAEQVLNCVHPTLDSEEKRRDVIDYVQLLVKSHLNCEAVSYGSVPLKTYLPDGDIDLTILKGPKADESLAHDVLALLQGEEQNENADFEVKDTQFIDAEVKLVKCLVRNIVIDISFNQLGGLSTLCFLEQVDRLVGRNHLFKRSIILVKTWCYYESRILGAHHGLISTYALETLILYIFHLFHSSLSGPLAVLHRFLDYYSQFDWENYCISLKGPVCKLSLPDIVVKMPESGRKDLLLSEEFLENCIEMFSVSSRGLEAQPKAFQTKHLNIIDPLKENNNLGRSVHRGNFYRIRSAFKYGARKLGQILLRPRDKVADEIHKFFANTCARHENQQRSSIRRLALEFDDEESLTSSLSSPVELLSEDDMLLQSSVSDFDNYSVDLGQRPILEFKNDMDGYSIIEVSSDTTSEACYSADGILISGHSITGDKDSLATSNSGWRTGTTDYISSSNYSASLSENHCHKQHDFSSKSSTENGILKAHQIDLACASEKFGLKSWLENKGVEDLSLDFRETDSMSAGGESEAFNPLADLTGDYDNHIRSLLRGQLCHGFTICEHVGFNPASSTSAIQTKKPWDIVRQSMPLRQNKFCQMNSHTISTEHMMHPGFDSALLGTAFQFEAIQKARGTGTYFPHVNVLYMDRPSQMKGRNKAPGNHNRHHRYGQNNGLYPASSQSNSSENGSHEIFPVRSRSQGQRRSEIKCQSPRFVGGRNHTNGYLSGSCRIEFGSIGNLAEEVISGSTHVRASTLSASLKTQGSSAMMIGERVAGKSIHLKNEDEFPPLCQ
ncbi:UNVERIFIED_CONTAM: hypothetical protein Slati_0663300 [Sesamum latifolium]|uniref:PAP/OAS1 substrate-binding-related domain-containing protein n=1 Tax=Sesamum latifolium TaxID=2727402 RepID=A0AAW2Y3Q6_9LAMI